MSGEKEEETQASDKLSWLPEGKTAAVMEVGCGVGNTMFPLMELNPRKYFIGFDCSPHAITNFKRREGYDENRCCKAFVLDITREDIPVDIIPDGSVDVALLVFVLSAISPSHFLSVLSKIYKVDEEK